MVRLRSLLEHLLAAAGEAGHLTLDRDPLLHQLISGDLPLTLACLFPDITPCRKLANDRGTLDTHTATIDWGDGTATEARVVTESPFGPPGSTSGANGTIAGTHVYADNGVYTVTVTVTDDDGAATSDNFTVTLVNHPLAAWKEIRGHWLSARRLGKIGREGQQWRRHCP